MIRTAHLVTSTGVTPIRFACTGDECTNLDEIAMQPGDWLDFGGGMTLDTGGVLEFATHLEL